MHTGAQGKIRVWGRVATQSVEAEESRIRDRVATAHEQTSRRVPIRNRADVGWRDVPREQEGGVSIMNAIREVVRTLGAKRRNHCQHPDRADQM